MGIEGKKYLLGSLHMLGAMRTCSKKNTVLEWQLQSHKLLTASFPDVCLSAVKTKRVSEEESVRGITTPPVLDLKLKPGFSLPGIL